MNDKSIDVYVFLKVRINNLCSENDLNECGTTLTQMATECINQEGCGCLEPHSIVLYIERCANE